MLRIHTFEMQKFIVTNDERRRIWENLRGIQVNILSTESYTRYRYYGLASKGVTIIIFLYKYVKQHKVCLQINPCTVLGIREGAMLFDVKEDRFLQCLQRIDQILRECHFNLWDYRITRVDFTQDIRFEKSEMIDIVIRLLKKTGAPMRYHYKTYGDTLYMDSYNIENQEGCEIAVYNKEKQYADRDEKERERVKGVMRIETRIKILDQSEEIFMQNMLCFPHLLNALSYAEAMIKNAFVGGFYIKANTTKQILRREQGRKGISKWQQNKLAKMVEFVDGVAVHQCLKGCCGGKNALFCYDTTKDIISQLMNRRINLVSISAKEPFTVIPDIKYMLGMKSEIEIQKDNQFLLEHNLFDKMPVYELL